MPDPTTLTREMPALSFRASVRPGSVDAEKRTAELVWTTGARVKRGFWEPYWEELSLDPAAVRMDRLNNGAPLLAAHDGGDLDAVLGVVESARLDKGQGTALVRFAKAEDDPEAEKVFRKVQDGILQNVSVGYRVYKLEQIEDGRTRDDKTPVLLATDWEPYELSVVPMGADDGAGFRGTTRAPNTCTFVAQRQERTMAEEIKVETPKPAAMPDEIAAVEQATRAAAAQRKSEAEARTAADGKAAEAAVKAERERATAIRAIVRRTDLGDEFADKLIKSGASLDSVRAAVLDHLAAKSEGGSDSHVRFEAGDDARDKFVRGACASIYARAGTASFIAKAKKMERFADQFRSVEVDPGEFRGMRLIDLARASLEMRGVSTKGLHGDTLVKRALDYRDGGMNTTSDFSIVLETAVNKTFLGRYATVPVTWRMWCGVKSVQDFRTATFYRPGSFGALDAVTESGEIKHKNIPDGMKRTLTPATKGNIVGLTRRAIVNDDLGAFRDLAAELGLAAAISVETDAWALVTANSGLGASYDANPLFHSSRSNIGPTGAMSVATLDGARAKMALQKDPASNQYLVLRPHCWLGPVELGGQIKVFNRSSADPTDYKNSSVANRVNGLFDDAHIIDSPYLSASSATRHYLLADPTIAPVFAVGFIDGQEAPVISSQQSFEYDGVQFKVVLDYGTAMLDYRGAITCAGA